VRHEHQETARQGYLGRATGALGADGLLGDLHHEALAALEHVLNLRRVLSLPTSTAAPLLRLGVRLSGGYIAAVRNLGGVIGAVRIVVIVIVIVIVIAVLVIDEIGRVQKGTLFGADVNKGGLNTRQHRFHFPEVNIADHPSCFRTLDGKLNELVVLENSHANFALRGADQNLSLHHRPQRNPWAATLLDRPRTRGKEKVYERAAGRRGSGMCPNDWSAALAVIAQVKPARTWFTHISHKLDAWLLDTQTIPAGLTIAGDGEQIEFTARAYQGRHSE
jgi:hypothetical protein